MQAQESQILLLSMQPSWRVQEAKSSNVSVSVGSIFIGEVIIYKNHILFELRPAIAANSLIHNAARLCTRFALLIS